MADGDPMPDERLEAALRGLADGGPAEQAPPPGEHVWAKIAAEAFGEQEVVPAEAAQRTEAAVVPLASRRRPATGWLLAAAAVVVLVVAVGALWAAGRGAEPTTLASGPVEGLDGEAATREATVVEVDGTTRLELDTSDLPGTDGYYEVWLGTPALDGLISLGPVRADGTYDLPEGVDVGAFPVVDVSVEQYDGDPGHSSDSLLRGALVEA